MAQLAGRVAVVTGGSRGIGAAIARALAAAGASVVSTSRSVSVASGESAGPAGSVVQVRADVRAPDQATRAIDEAASRFGGLDILVNNAGIGLFADVADMSVDQWQQVIETNLNGVFYCCRAAIPHLRRRGGGWIVNISSLAGKNAFTGGAAYCASKAALNQFSEALMLEVRHDGIRVSCIMPGSVETDFGAGGSKSWAMRPEDIAQAVLDLLEMPARTLPSRIEMRPSRPPKR
jgi:NAD(P)-dependent dehydrogenase (short-subunit alcohol dehydrogenase family)